MIAALVVFAQWQQPLPQPLPPIQPPPPMGWTPPQQQAQPPPDEGRGLEWFWARAEVGASYTHLLLDEKTASGGVLFGAAAGARLLFFTAGARFRYHQLADYNLVQVSGMLGAHIPYGWWDFGADLYLGWAGAPSLSPSPSGFHVGLEGGADYYLAKWFSLGATIDFELLFLGRAGKNGVGLGTALVPHAAIHF